MALAREIKARNCLDRNGVKLVSSIKSLMFEVKGIPDKKTGEAEVFSVINSRKGWNCDCRAGSLGMGCYHVEACRIYCQEQNIPFCESI
jgi:hypothetical protein